MRRTTIKKLQKIIADNLVSVTSAVVNYDDRGKEPISTDKFKEDLEFYANSGIFANTLDFTFEKVSDDQIHIAIGKMSSYCYDDMDVTLQLNEGEKAGVSLNSDNQKSFNDLSINASTLDDIKQMESYLRLARTEYQTFNAEIAKGTHASSLEAMKNSLETLPQEIALIEAKFNSIKISDNVKTQIEELKASMESINSISDPQEKIAKYNEIVASLKNLQKQYQVTAQEQKKV